MRLKTFNDIDVRDKVVMLRADFNIESEHDGTFAPWEEFKIKSIFPTLEFLLKRRAKIIIVSHRGRPTGVDPSLSLEPVVEHFKKMVGASSSTILRQAQDDVLFAPSIYHIKPDVLKPGVIVVAENIRFQRGEELGDLKFAKSLAAMADVFVNDAFSVVHRKDSSVSKVPTLVPSAAGLALSDEFSRLRQLVMRPPRPFSVVLAGGKADTKFELIEPLLKRADYFFVGGTIANTFYKAAGFEIGASQYEESYVPKARRFVSSPRMLFLDDSLNESLVVDLSKARGRAFSSFSKRLLLPCDIGVGIIKGSERRDLMVNSSLRLADDESILDAGSQSSDFLAYMLKRSKQVMWNGPLGYFEHSAFADSTKQFVHAISSASTKVLLGGGETVAAYYRFGGSLRRNVSISTGGGAMLEFFLDQKLPGLLPLLK